MAEYFLSQNPTISNFGSSPLIDEDTFVVDTASASSLTINQEGTNVVVSDGTNSAVFTNFTLEQLGEASFANNGNPFTAQLLNTFDGSQILIGSAQPDTNNAGFDLDDGGSLTNDYIAGLAGNDVITGGAGNDLIYGNQGDDTVTFDGNNGLATGNSTVFGGQGNDTISGSDANGNPTTSGNNLIYGNNGNDILTTGAGNDVLFGGQGADVLTSLGANSTMSGGQGDDIIDASGSLASSTNLIYGNQGNDQIVGGELLKDTVYGGQGNDIVNYDNVTGGNGAALVAGGIGTSGALIYGNVGDDLITGSSAADTLFGGQGDDVLIGNINGAVNTDTVVNGAVQAGNASGHDVMTGGQGSNTFVQTALTTGATTATSDVITDFVSGADKIEGSTAGTAANFSAVQSTGTTTADEAAVIGAAAAAANPNAAGSSDIYTFVAGKTNGYLVDTDAAGTVGVTTLTGLTSIADVKYTDIIGGADTVAGGGTVA